MRTVSRRSTLASLALLPWLARAQALPAEIAAELAGARLQGRGRLTFLGLKVYEAKLWVADSFAAEDFERQPLALELIYARTLYGQLIAERSLVEMKKVGTVSQDDGERWLAEMRQTFPDVADGDRITGLHRPGESLRFFLNGSLRGEIRDAEFGRLFIGIWLSPRTSEPQLRQALLGAARSST